MVKEILTSLGNDLVVFTLNNQYYAISIAHVVQIIEMVTITPIPQISPVVAGMINVRGTSLPVINMRRYIGLSDMAIHLHTPIILVQIPLNNGMQQLGMIVDEVVDVMQAASDAITQMPDILPQALRDTPLVQGVVHTSDGALTILLDLSQLFESGDSIAEIVSRIEIPSMALENG